MKSKLILFLLIISSCNLFSQSNDDVYFDGVEENRVEKTVSSEQFNSEETNIYVEPDLDYTSRIRRFHQPVRGFGYYNNFYCNQFWHNSYSINYYPYNYYGFNNYYVWNNWYNYWWYNWHQPYYNSWHTPYNQYGWNNNWHNWNTNNSWNWFDRPTTTNVVTSRNPRSSDGGVNRSRNVPVRGYDIQQRQTYQTYTPEVRFERTQNIRTESNFARSQSGFNHNNTINTRNNSISSGRR